MKKKPKISTDLNFTKGLKNSDGKTLKYTVREKLFVLYYLTDAKFNASAAARLAGYECTSDNSFRVLACRMMKTEKIKLALNAALENFVMPKMEILARIADIARGNITDALDDDGNFNLETARENGSNEIIKKLKIERSTRIISESEIDAPPDAPPIEIEREILDETITIEMYSKLEALKELGKHFQLFTDKIKVESDAAGGSGQVILYLPDNGRDPEAKPIPAPAEVKNKPDNSNKK